ncbi:MAG: ribonuclease P protein component [Bacteroidetes bacterium HGW-Bacteroidetes-7]|nr:MAG: ribonuclease P protein component [Bacteroidetes bacterium HGW-Bacteroidetes-7]
MNSQTNLKFGKSIKLCSEITISELFREGVIVFNHPFKIYYQPNNLNVSRVLISVPKRAFKRAVDRNFIKRRIREALRLNNFARFFENCKDISIVYIGKELPETAILNQKIKDVLDKIKRDHKDAPVTSVSNSD